MARTTRPLTNTEVKQAKPKAKEYNLVDGQGLALRIKPNGSKLWLFNYYRPFTKKRANLSLGNYPTTSLAEARKMREEARQLLAQDIDPKEKREELEAKTTKALRNTLELVAAQWFELKKTKVTPNYAEDIWSSLKLHIFPQLGKLPLQQITAPKTIDTLKPIAAKGNYETIKRLCQRLNEIMIFAVNSGLLENNPLAGIKNAFQSPTKTNMPTIRPEQLPELVERVKNASIKLVTRHLIFWQLHTMTRPSEAAGTRWDEIDFDKKQWTIPEHRTKKRRVHIVPLSPEALAILEGIKPISGHREYVFPADRKPRTCINEQTANMALKRMGYGGVLVAHGLRALASTTLNEHGFDSDVIEAALAHVDGNEVRRAYNRAEYIERRRAMMCWWSQEISNENSPKFKISQIR
ncbi:MAG: integrase [Lentisphaeria bacterium]|jgi:integrase